MSVASQLVDRVHRLASRAPVAKLKYQTIAGDVMDRERVVFCGHGFTVRHAVHYGNAVFLTIDDGAGPIEVEFHPAELVDVVLPRPRVAAP